METDFTLERDQAQFFRATGRRTPDGGWPAGRYSAKAELLRDGISRGQLADALELR